MFATAVRERVGLQDTFCSKMEGAGSIVLRTGRQEDVVLEFAHSVAAGGPPGWIAAFSMMHRAAPFLRRSAASRNIIRPAPRPLFLPGMPAISGP